MLRSYRVFKIVVLIVLAATTASADTVQISFTRLSGSVAEGTAIFRSDLSSLTLSEIRSIMLVDSNSMVGGSPGAFSGFDLDAIKLSSTFATSAAQASAAVGLSVFDFSPAGTIYTPGTQRPPVAPKLFGTDASGFHVDPSFATLSVFDAIFFVTGAVTLGDGGKISFDLTAPTQPSGLYLYIGEVSGDPGEDIAGALSVSSQPISAQPVPEPTTVVLFLVGLALMPVCRRLRIT